MINNQKLSKGPLELLLHTYFHPKPASNLQLSSGVCSDINTLAEMQKGKQ